MKTVRSRTTSQSGDNEEKRFRAVVESAPNAVVMVDQSGRIVLVNAQTERLFGYAREELLGQPVEILVPSASKVSHPVLLRNFFTHPQARPMGAGRDLFGLRKDGTRFPVEIGLNPIETAEGLCVVSSVVDLTGRKRAEQEAVARQKLESLGVLAGGIAHDFNNLMGSILMEADSLLTSDSPDREGVERIKTLALRGAEIVRELMPAGEEANVLAPIDLSRLVREALRLLKVSISKRAELRVNLPVGLPAIHANAAQMLQVVMNLVSNASEALGEEEGIITVGTKLVRSASSPQDATSIGAGDYIRLAVSDTGCGMTDEIKARIFDPFFTTKSNGHGLGLAAVRGIIQRHGGAITVTSTPGHGTRFEVFLRSAASHPMDPTSQLTAPQEESGGTVLLVEDEPALRSAVSKALRRSGYSVIETGDGRIGADLFRANEDTIRAVLLDMSLPGMSGAIVFSELRRLRPDVKVILTTAFSRETAVDIFGPLPAWAFLRKPYHLTELVDLVHKACLRPAAGGAGG